MARASETAGPGPAEGEDNGAVDGADLQPAEVGEAGTDAHVRGSRGAPRRYVGQRNPTNSPIRESFGVRHPRRDELMLDVEKNSRSLSLEELVELSLVVRDYGDPFTRRRDAHHRLPQAAQRLLRGLIHVFFYIAFADCCV